jgi:hypothetical protein
VNSVLTLGGFLQQTGAAAHFFDLGRRVVEIPPATLAAFEQAGIPYPQPFLRAAWLGVLFRHQGGHLAEEAPVIWFLRFPLDEQGKLIQAARDDFLGRLLNAADATANLDDNPHGFAPRPERMAVFHAKAAKLLGQAPSQFYGHAQEYFRGALGFEQWNFVGLQGIADVAARLDEDGNAAMLARAIPHLPAQPFTALCNCLENEAVDAALSRVLIERIAAGLAGNDPATVAAGIRGLSHGADRAAVAAAINLVLDGAQGSHVEVLAAIAGRAWETLEDAALQHRFLERLAGCEAGKQAFDNILADLLFLPALRESLRRNLKSPSHSGRLNAALHAFLQRTTS